MPRLSPKQYVDVHYRLRFIWLYHQKVFAYLHPDHQRQLHDFFRPADDLTTEELKLHRKSATAAQPNLPHQAGHALQVLYRLIDHPGQLPDTATLPTQRGKIRIYGLIQPILDYDKLAQAIWMLAKQQVEQKRKDGSATSTPDPQQPNPDSTS